MTSNIESQELTDRLSLIEQMIAEGRRTTESWGWTFVLWGVAYYVAIAWATLGKASLAWPVTMVAAGVLTAVLASRTESKRPETTLGRAMLAIWLGMGVSIFVLMMSLGLSGRLTEHVSIAIIGAMLGGTNCTSSIILKWKMQFACALAWWGVGVAACFTSDTVTSILFLTAIFFCQIVFGIYGMIAEASKQKRHGAGQGAFHA